MKQEIWVELFTGAEYKISNLGNVRRDRPPSTDHRPRKLPDSYPLKPNKTLAGYYQIHAHQKPYSIHREVARLFVPNPQNKPQVNHLNGNKLDNRAVNLGWTTPKENLDHAVKNGLIKTGANSKCAKPILDTATGVFYYGVEDAAKAFDMKKETLACKFAGIKKYTNNTTLIYA